METVCEWPVLVQACKVGASRKHGSDCEAQANLFAKQIRRRYAGQTNRIHWEVGAHADGIPTWQARGPGMVSACCSRRPSPWPITGADFSGLGRFDFIVGRRTWTSDVGLRNHPGWCVAMGSDIGHMPVQTLVDFEGLPHDAPKSSIICEGSYIIVQGKKKSQLLIVLGVVVQCARNVETWYCASRKVLI